MGKHALFLLIFLMISCGKFKDSNDNREDISCKNGATIKVVTTHLLNKMTDINYGTFNDGRYRVPLSKELSAFHHAANELIKGRYCQAQLSAKPINMVVEKIVDPDGGTYHCLSGKKGVAAARGIYCINNTPQTKPLHIAIPHPLHDRNTSIEGTVVFQNTDAKYLSIATAHRRSSRQRSTCQRHYKQSDMAHNRGTFFHIFAKNVHNIDQKSYHIQLHGYSKAYQHDVAIVSVGTSKNIDEHSIATRFTRSLERQIKSPRKDVLNCNNSEDDALQTLCATGNIQGRYINGLTDNPCKKGKRTFRNSRFLHIEQTKWIRGNLLNEPDHVHYIEPKYDLISNALNEVFSQKKYPQN